MNLYNSLYTTHIASLVLPAGHTICQAIAFAAYSYCYRLYQYINYDAVCGDLE